MIRNFWTTLVLLVLLAGPLSATEFEIGLFQAGDYTPHGALREALHNSLEALLPTDTTVVFQATAFRSAAWNRDSSRAMARELAAMRDIDMVVTIGPWVVEDLIAAGFSKPIIALFRTDPYLEGLTDSTLVPVYRNLTVQVTPSRISADVRLLYRLKPFKKLGVLYFPSGQDSTALINELADIVKPFGAEAVTAFGSNNVGTYAFLRAYGELPADVDAVYVLPMWGLDADKIRDLTQRLSSDRKTSASFEGLYAVDKGILVSSAGIPYEAEARFAAWKMLQIMRGVSPQTLSTELPFDADITINEQTAARLGIDVTLEMATQADLVKAPDESAQRFSMADMVQRALDLNPGYLAWDDIIAQAQAQAAAVRSGYFPQVSVDGSATYVDDNRLSNEAALVRDPDVLKNDRYRASLNIEQPIFSFETIRSGKVASRQSQARLIGKEDAALQIESDVTQAYLDYVQAAELRAIYRRQLQLADHGSEIARGMFATGERDRSDMIRWESEELRTRQELATSDANVRVAEVYLNALMNQSGNSRMQLDSTIVSSQAFWNAYERIRQFIVTETARQRTTDRLVSAAVGAQPAMRLASEEIEIQKARISNVWSSLYPSVGLRASFALTDELDTTPSFEEKGNSWSVGAVLRWSLFDGGRRGKESRGAKARLSQLEYQRDQVSLQVMSRVSSLVRQLASAATLVLAAEQENELATAMIAPALARYSSAKEGYVVAIDAANAARDAQVRLINARCEFFKRLSLLLREVGWSPHAANTSPSLLLQQRLRETTP